jgi:hypothetical protein
MANINLNKIASYVFVLKVAHCAMLNEIKTITIILIRIAIIMKIKNFMFIL